MKQKKKLFNFKILKRKINQKKKKLYIAIKYKKIYKMNSLDL